MFEQRGVQGGHTNVLTKGKAVQATGNAMTQRIDSTVRPLARSLPNASILTCRARGVDRDSSVVSENVWSIGRGVTRERNPIQCHHVTRGMQVNAASSACRTVLAENTLNQDYLGAVHRV